MANQAPGSTERIYLDHAAATPVDARVVRAMEPYWSDSFANAGALHREGVAARDTVETARRAVAQVISAQSDEIIFTSGGTEGNSLAIMGTAQACGLFDVPVHAPAHFITTQVEHRSILDAFRVLASRGATVTYLPVDRVGKVSAEALRAAITATTVLVSIIMASNEIGTLQPIRELAAVVRAVRHRRGGAYPRLHVDASQVPAWLPIHTPSLGADLVTLDAQKLYGPKSIGCLVRARGVPLHPILYGGGQEGGLRPGTPPVPLIVGFAEALRLVNEERDTYVSAIAARRDRFIERVKAGVPDTELHGALGHERLPNNVNVSFPGVAGDRLVIELDAQGIACSTRSACMGTEGGGSYVVRALGKGEGWAESAVRFSLGRATDDAACDRAADVLIQTVVRLRAE